MQSKRGNPSDGRPSPYDGVYGDRTAGSVSYGQVGGDTLRDCVERITNRGDAVLFGRTADGGALSIQILSGGKASKFYVTDGSELLELLTGLIAAVERSK